MNDAEDIITTESEPGEVGLIEPRDFISSESFTFESGQVLNGFTIRYETYGRLSSLRNNAILVCHALSGDHHCAGIHSLNDRKPGWWNNLIGPGKPLDTNHFFVICSNVPGGCQGSTPPSSLNSATGNAFRGEFPSVTSRGIVRGQKRLRAHLQIPSLHAVLGAPRGCLHVLPCRIH